MATYNDCKALVPHQQALVYNFQAVSPVNTLEKCLPHAPVLIADVKELVSTHDMSKLPKYLEDVMATYNDCKDLFPQTTAINDINDIVKCIGDLEPLVNDIKSAVENKDFTKILTILQEAYTAFTDCKAAIPHK